MTMHIQFDEVLQAERKKDVVPATTFNTHIGSPGSSLDLREFQRSRSAPKRRRTAKPIQWRLGSRQLPRTVGLTINVATRVEARLFQPGFTAAHSYNFKWRVSGQSTLISAAKRPQLALSHPMPR
jgi:hypothetical protein